MKIHYVLRRPGVAVLWSTQVFSAVGDELYAIAVAWLAVQVAGPKAGWVMASQALARVVFSTIGGVAVDRWNRRRTMIAADLARGVAVASLPLAASRGPVTLAHLALVGAIVGAFDAFFRPALKGSLPALARPGELTAINALMDLTERLARVGAPALAAFAATLLPTIHFLSVDAATFAASALGVLLLRGRLGAQSSPSRGASEPARRSVREEIAEATALVRGHRPLVWALVALAVTNAAWHAAWIVGLPLFVRRDLGRDLGAYGSIVLAYGAGSLVANGVIGSVRLRRPVVVMFGGHAVIGAGFLALALAKTVPAAMAAAAVASAGGPMGDLLLLTMLQTQIPAAHFGKIYGLRTIVESGGGAIGLALATSLFARVSAPVGILAAALALCAIGAIGMLRFGPFASEAAGEIEPR